MKDPYHSVEVRRFRLRFGLRSLLLAMAAICVVLAWAVWQAKPVRNELRAQRAICEAGGALDSYLTLRDSAVTAAGLEQLKSPPNFKHLTIQGKSRLTEPELARLEASWPNVLICRELPFD
jgi:hypothetical protein